MSKSFEEELIQVLDFNPDIETGGVGQEHIDSVVGSIKDLIRKHRPEKKDIADGYPDSYPLNTGYNSALDDYDRNLGL